MPRTFTVNGIHVQIIDIWWQRNISQMRAIVEWMEDDTEHGIAKGSVMNIDAETIDQMRKDDDND